MEEGKGNSILPVAGTQEESIEELGPFVIPGGKEHQGRHVPMLGLGCHHHV